MDKTLKLYQYDRPDTSWMYKTKVGGGCGQSRTRATHVSVCKFVAVVFHNTADLLQRLVLQSPFQQRVNLCSCLFRFLWSQTGLETQCRVHSFSQSDIWWTTTSISYACHHLVNHLHMCST